MLQTLHARYMKNKSKGLFNMDNIKNIEETEKFQKKIKELFKTLVSDDFYDTWADTFEIDCIDDNQIIVRYHGIYHVKRFKKECKKILFSCIYSVIGEDKKIKISSTFNNNI